MGEVYESTKKHSTRSDINSGDRRVFFVEAFLQSRIAISPCFRAAEA